MSKLSDRLDRIEELLEELVALTKKDVLTYPAPNPESPYQPFPTYTPPVLNPVRCTKCGIELHTSMGYVCNDIECPTGLGPVRCTGI
jgi:hypothetical protein